MHASSTYERLRCADTAGFAFFRVGVGFRGSSDSVQRTSRRFGRLVLLLLFVQPALP